MSTATRRALVLLAVAIVLAAAGVVYGQLRSVCVTETTAPFFAHTARGLATALDPAETDADPQVLARQLEVDADRLDTVEDRCRIPWP